MAWLFTGPAKRPSVLDDDHHLLLLIRNDASYGLEAQRIQTDGKEVVTVCRPIRYFMWRHRLYAAVFTEIGSENIPIYLNWEVIHGYPYRQFSPVSGLESEIFCCYVVSGKF